jgi:hypothetical protein
MAGSITVSSITLDSDNTFSIRSNTGANLFTVEGGVESIRIDSNGNVGIGTSSPGYKLDVITPAQGTDGITVGTTSTHYASLKPNSGSGNYNPMVQAGDAALIYAAGGIDTGAIVIGQWSNSAKGMRIASDGKVGIGTTSPGRELDVNGSIRFVSGGVIEAGSAGGLNTYIAGVDGGSGYWSLAVNGAEQARLTVGGNLQFNSGYGSVATAYGCRAWVNFNGTTAANVTGTYSQTGTTVTVTITGHGYLTGQPAFLDFTSGTAVDGVYSVTVTGDNTFTVTQASRTTSGNVTSRRNTIRGSGNVSSVTDNAVGTYTVNFTTAMPDANYAVAGSTITDGRIFNTAALSSSNVTVYNVGAGGSTEDNGTVSVAIFR